MAREIVRGDSPCNQVSSRGLEAHSVWRKNEPKVRKDTYRLKGMTNGPLVAQDREGERLEDRGGRWVGLRLEAEGDHHGISGEATRASTAGR